MAKINSANVAPDAYPRIRGVILTRTTKHAVIVQKWPEKRGPAKTPQAAFLSQQFAKAGRMAANAETMAYETAKFMAQGTVWLPRDILVMAAYGKLYELTGPNGEIFTQADHGYIPPVEPVSNTVKQWQTNSVNGTLGASPSGSGAAAKGTCFVPTAAMELYKATVPFQAVNGAQYNIFVCALNSSDVIQSIVTGTSRTLTGTAYKFYEFECRASLAAGTRYAIMLARIDSTNTYALPISNIGGANWLFDCDDRGFARLAKAIPVVGDTVTVSAGSYAMNLLLDF